MLNKHNGSGSGSTTIEHKTSQGNIIAFACGPLTKPRYINPKIETELIDFKKEIEEKFAKSKLRSFRFPLKKQSKLPDALRSTRYANSHENSNERDAAPPINGQSSSRKNVNQSSFISYQGDQMHARPQYAQVDSPRRHGGAAGGGQHMMEQTRYNDIMRSINNTEQFIKAKQAMAAQERGKVGGRNAKKNLHLTEIHAVANSTGSSLMQTQYSKSPFEQPLAGAPAGPGNVANKMGRQSKLKVKLGNVHQSTERAPRGEEALAGSSKPPVRYKHQTKYPKHLHGSQD